MMSQPLGGVRTAMRATVLIASLIAIGARPAGGQESAGVVGQLTDHGGGVLPGVTVTVTGPALQVPSMVAVTDSRGEYRITPLPIGTYVVEYSLSGFATVRREGVRLTVGFTAKLDIVLEVGGIAETVTVAGGSPVIDVVSTATTTQITRETIELLPSSRNSTISLLAQAPAMSEERASMRSPNIACSVKGANPMRSSKASGQAAAPGPTGTTCRLKRPRSAPSARRPTCPLAACR